jgi:MYXO-CTERM domain-containing protein
MRFSSRGCVPLSIVSLLAAFSAADCNAGIIVSFSEASGLAGEAEFTLVNPTTIQVRLRNLSTGAPGGFDNSMQLLTSVAFDLGGVGNTLGDPTIVGGTVFTGASSASVNFSVANVGANADVSGEWGFGNGGTTGFFTHLNFISSNNAEATAFGPVNLDATDGLDGPQGGLVASPAVIALGGLGAIQDEIVATITVSSAVSDLSFLANGVTFEFGSDAAFITVPAPGALALLGFAGLVGARRRRA